MAFKKGQSGNPKGQSKGKPITDMLYRLCVQEDWERLRTALSRQLDKAVEGDQMAVNFIADRLEGKPTQTIEGDINVSSIAGILSGIAASEANDLALAKGRSSSVREGSAESKPH